MHALVMYYSATDFNAALTAINAVADQSVTLAADAVGIVVPSKTPKLAGVFGVMEPATALQIQLQSPSLRLRTYPSIEPFTLDASVPASPIPEAFWGRAPTDLDSGETLQVFVDSDEAVAQYVGVVLADAPMAPAPGRIQSVRFTATPTSTAATWVAGAITLDQPLTTGRYSVVGLRIRGTGLVAGRLIFPDRTARPGVPAALGLGGLDTPWSRYGAVSDWGQFDSTNLPQIEVIGGTASAFVGTLDLIRV